MREIFIGLGTNLGDKKNNLEQAITLMKQKCKILKQSKLYETEPVGYKDQDWFLNCVVEIETELDPLELFDFLQSIEKEMKRIKTVKDGPRVIDLDILFYEDQVINHENLIIPHPRLHERLFVLIPMSDINPNFNHPTFGETIKELRDECNDQKIKTSQDQLHS